MRRNPLKNKNWIEIYRGQGGANLEKDHIAGSRKMEENME
jgi:hypothetical protein